MTGEIEIGGGPWGCSGMADKCTETGRMGIYVQPKKRQMYRPAITYCPQTAKTETNSIYRQAHFVIRLRSMHRFTSLIEYTWSENHMF